MAKRRTGNQIKPYDRKQAMMSLRKSGVSDMAISKAFGISRERAAQILGRNRATEEYRKLEKEKEKILSAMVKDGRSSKEMGERLGRTASWAYQTLERMGIPYSDFHEQRLKRRREALMDEVIEFLEKYDVPLTIPSFIRHNRSLWGKMNRNGHIKEWRDEVTKEVKKRGLDLEIRGPYSKR